MVSSGVDAFGRKDVTCNRRAERLEVAAQAPTQSASVDTSRSTPLARVDAALPVERHVRGEFAEQNFRQQMSARTARARSDAQGPVPARSYRKSGRRAAHARGRSPFSAQAGAPGSR